MTSSLSEYARRVREEADIVEIIGTVVPLKRTGVNYKGLCPFHREKTPSFTVHPANQRFKCFGCGAGGDVIRFWMMHERLSYPEALEQMGRRLGLEPPRMAGRTEEDHDEQRRRNLLGIHEFAMEWFEHHLQSADAVHAREYLKKRGLTPADIKTFRLGYAPDEWDAFGETARRKGYSQQLLLDSGLAVLEEGQSV